MHMRLIGVTNFVDEMDMDLYEFAKRFERMLCADLKMMDAQMRGMDKNIDEIGKKASEAGLKVRKDKKKQVRYNTKAVMAWNRARNAAYKTLRAIHSGSGSGSGSGSDRDSDSDRGSGTGCGNGSDRDTDRDDDK